MLGAGTSPEHPMLDLDMSLHGVQFNVALNNRCALERDCGDRCLLNNVQPATVEMDEEVRLAAIGEIFEAGRTVRFLSLCEKEVFASPQGLFDVLRSFHSRPRDQRPQSVGALTNGLELHRHFSRLAELPLDWCLVSLDGLARTHHRGAHAWKRSFQNMLDLRDTGGSRLIGVNTVVTAENLDSVIGLGHLLEPDGIDYWGLGVYLQPNDDGRVVASLDPERTGRVVERLADGFASSSMPIVFEVEPEVFEQISGIDLDTVNAGPWRLEHPIEGTPVRVATVSPVPGRWLRLRFDGQLIDKSDLLRVRVVHGRYGRYEPGKITRMLQRIGDAWDSPSPLAASLA